MDDLKTKRSFDSQASCVINVFGLFSDILSMGVCTTRLLQTSGRLVQELNGCIVYSTNSKFLGYNIVSGIDNVTPCTFSQFIIVDIKLGFRRVPWLLQLDATFQSIQCWHLSPALNAWACLGVIHDRAPDCHPVSWACMHICPHN